MSILIDNFTVVIPTYNRLEMLREMLDSIPRTINVIISDNGGSIPDDFTAYYPEFKFFKTDQVLSAPENWNNCVRLCQTEWFTIPSDDDLYYPNAFDTIAKHLENEKETDLLIFGHNTIDGEGKITDKWMPGKYIQTSPPQSYLNFKYGVESRFPAMIFKKKIVIDNGGFPLSYTLTAGDSKLVQQCMLTGRISFIPEIFSAYRVWKNSTTSQTLSTSHWLSEIDRWQNEILEEAVEKFKRVGLTLPTNHIKDEVYANNLLGGLKIIKDQKGAFASAKFLFDHRFPWNAHWRTKLRVIKTILIG